MLTSHRCWVYGDHVSTDAIFPPRYIVTSISRDALAAHALADLDPTFATNVQPGDVVVAGENWGCGSCRDQAVIALKAAGIDMIMAASFHDHYFRNCISFGIQPIILPELREWVATGDTILLDRAARRLIVQGMVFAISSLDDAAQAVLNAGGVAGLIAGKCTDR